MTIADVKEEVAVDMTLTPVCEVDPDNWDPEPEERCSNPANWMMRYLCRCPEHMLVCNEHMIEQIVILASIPPEDVVCRDCRQAYRVTFLPL